MLRVEGANVRDVILLQPISVSTVCHEKWVVSVTYFDQYALAMLTSPNPHW